MKRKVEIWAVPVLMSLIGAWAMWECRIALETVVDRGLYWLCGLGMVMGISLVSSWAYSETKEVKER